MSYFYELPRLALLASATGVFNSARPCRRATGRQASVSFLGLATATIFQVLAAYDLGSSRTWFSRNKPTRNMSGPRAELAVSNPLALS
jgi:hypothetical protein